MYDPVLICPRLLRKLCLDVISAYACNSARRSRRSVCWMWACRLARLQSRELLLHTLYTWLHHSFPMCAKPPYTSTIQEPHNDHKP